MKVLATTFVLVTALSSIGHAQSHRRAHGPGGPGGGPMIHPMAPQPAEFTYKALNVRERETTRDRVGARTIEKSIGGLSCKKISEVGPMSRFPRYTCELSTRRVNGAAIYAALNVPARRDRRPSGSYIIDFKDAGKLSCREVRSLRETKTTCTLD